MYLSFKCQVGSAYLIWSISSTVTVHILLALSTGKDVRGFEGRDQGLMLANKNLVTHYTVSHRNVDQC